MYREVLAPRPDWIERVEAIGFTYHSAGRDPKDDPGTNWYESACYRFDLAQIEVIEAATVELHRLCLAAVDDIVRRRPHLMDQFGIPKPFQAYIRRSYERGDPTIKGRFDLAFDPATNGVKMLEYNADTPTLAIETALAQWYWLQDVKPHADQFNSLHEKLIAQYASLAGKIPAGKRLHFSCVTQYREELQHTIYFQDLATQAGIRTDLVPIDRIGLDRSSKRLVDQHDRPIDFLAALYPWEWLAVEEFGPHLLDDRIGMLEPVWKMLLSNKAILPVLWDLFPGHPNLLESTFVERNWLTSGRPYIKKPILSREGSNIRLVRPGQPDLITDGEYGASPVIYQQVADLPCIDGQYSVIGSWVVGTEAAGMILRESGSPIVVSDSRVVPHYFVD